MRHAYLGNGLKKVGNHWPISICWWTNFFQQKRQQRQWSAKESTDFTAYLESDKNKGAKQVWTTSWSCMVLVPESHWKMFSRTTVRRIQFPLCYPNTTAIPQRQFELSNWWRFDPEDCVTEPTRKHCTTEKFEKSDWRTMRIIVDIMIVWRSRGKTPNTIPRDPHYFLIITGDYANGALGQFRLCTLSW